ncbi:unnamed protein product [Amoebophrya sp. A25]|nr:unnamed protein product [Amoebophrya sp. A25]|eukprot:GSA25T00025396001.1
MKSGLRRPRVAEHAKRERSREGAVDDAEAQRLRQENAVLGCAIEELLRDEGLSASLKGGPITRERSDTALNNIVKSLVAENARLRHRAATWKQRALEESALVDELWEVALALPAIEYLKDGERKASTEELQAELARERKERNRVEAGRAGDFLQIARLEDEVEQLRQLASTTATTAASSSSKRAITRLLPPQRLPLQQPSEEAGPGAQSALPQRPNAASCSALVGGSSSSSTIIQSAFSAKQLAALRGGTTSGKVVTDSTGRKVGQFIPRSSSNHEPGRPTTIEYDGGKEDEDAAPMALCGNAGGGGTADGEIIQSHQQTSGIREDRRQRLVVQQCSSSSPGE